MTDDNDLNPPKELYDKFDEFLGLLFELDKMKDALYNQISQRVAATLDMMGERKGFELADEFTAMFVSLRFVKNDEGDYKVLERAIHLRWSHDIPRSIKRAMELLDGFCKELNAAKVPEPEVLIQEKGPKRLTYKISGEWMTWFRNALPHYPPEAAFEMGGLRAAKKYFQRDPLDKIERSSTPLGLSSACYGAVDRDLEIEFYRVTREKL